MRCFLPTDLRTREQCSAERECSASTFLWEQFTCISTLSNTHYILSGPHQPHPHLYHTPYHRTPTQCPSCFPHLPCGSPWVNILPSALPKGPQHHTPSYKGLQEPPHTQVSSRGLILFFIKNITASYFWLNESCSFFVNWYCMSYHIMQPLYYRFYRKSVCVMPQLTAAQVFE